MDYWGRGGGGAKGMFAPCQIIGVPCTPPLPTPMNNDNIIDNNELKLL